MLARSQQLSFGNEFALLFQSRNGRPKDFRRGMGKVSLAQSFARHSARQRLALVMGGDCFKRCAAQALKVFRGDEDSFCINHSATFFCLCRRSGQEDIIPARASRDVGKPLALISSGSNVDRETSCAICLHQGPQ